MAKTNCTLAARKVAADRQTDRQIKQPPKCGQKAGQQRRWHKVEEQEAIASAAAAAAVTVAEAATERQSWLHFRCSVSAFGEAASNFSSSALCRSQINFALKWKCKPKTHSMPPSTPLPATRAQPFGSY